VFIGFGELIEFVELIELIGLIDPQSAIEIF